MIIAYDLGTGGVKASLYSVDGSCQASTFEPYQTIYPNAGWHEQRPEDWWKAVVSATRTLMDAKANSPADVDCLAISGQSLAVIPLDAGGSLLRDSIPIWSDTRATGQTAEFFGKVDRDQWYMTTGNGFPAECYSVFKIMWYRDNEPSLFSRAAIVLGSKDYINFRLTGEIFTDYSYASGAGIYDLMGWRYSEEFIQAEPVASVALSADRAVDADHRETHRESGRPARPAPRREGGLRRCRQFLHGLGRGQYRRGKDVHVTGILFMDRRLLEEARSRSSCEALRLHTCHPGVIYFCGGHLCSRQFLQMDPRYGHGRGGGSRKEWLGS